MADYLYTNMSPAKKKLLAITDVQPRRLLNLFLKASFLLLILLDRQTFGYGLDFCFQGPNEGTSWKIRVSFAFTCKIASNTNVYSCLSKVILSYFKQNGSQASSTTLIAVWNAPLPWRFANFQLSDVNKLDSKEKYLKLCMETKHVKMYYRQGIFKNIWTELVTRNS